VTKCSKGSSEWQMPPERHLADGSIDNVVAAVDVERLAGDELCRIISQEGHGTLLQRSALFSAKPDVTNR
jgi:hypothetical protein